MSGTRRTRNERLAEAMARSQLGSSHLAAAIAVDPRTIDRWVEDRSRVPRAESRQSLARLLEVPVGVLWPGVASGPQVSEELVALYPNRKALPGGHVMSLLDAASERIDVLALAAVWLWDVVPQFGATLAGKAGVGVEVRVCLGDPRGESARSRGEEEGIGALMGSRCELALGYAQGWLGAESLAIRLHDTTLYATILRFDDDVLVNWHLFGAPAADSPVLHLRRTERGTLADSAIESFDRVWGRAYPPAR
jgi:hypothetical protein